MTSRGGMRNELTFTCAQFTVILYVTVSFMTSTVYTPRLPCSNIICFTVLEKLFPFVNNLLAAIELLLQKIYFTTNSMEYNNTSRSHKSCPPKLANSISFSSLPLLAYLSCRVCQFPQFLETLQIWGQSAAGHRRGGETPAPHKACSEEVSKQVKLVNHSVSLTW